MIKRIYVASSWKNLFHPSAVADLKAEGYDVFDFRHPEPGNSGFQWRNTIPGFDPESCDVEQFRQVLDHPVAIRGAELDTTALIKCDACVMVLPCGNSSHIELGHAIGAGNIGIIWAPVPFKADLMYSLAHYISSDFGKIIQYLNARR